nr:transposase, Ptta/En/Spm, transposase, Tnp1/En/Spm-like protein [Tanacetum cinerariifolium]
MIIKKDFEIVKAKGERKSVVIMAKKESTDEECLTSGSEYKEYAMAVRDFKKFFKRRDARSKSSYWRMSKTTKDKNQRAFVRGSWSDRSEEDDEKTKDETPEMIIKFITQIKWNMKVKEKQEKDKIRTKPDKIKIRREAWKSPTIVTVHQNPYFPPSTKPSLLVNLITPINTPGILILQRKRDTNWRKVKCIQDAV